MDRFDNVSDTPNYQDSNKLNHTFDAQVGSMYNVSKALAQQDKHIDEIDTRKGYSKTETDNLLNAKADADNVYTKTETDDLLNNKADADNVYTKTETDNLLTAKADADNVYTKTETDNLLTAKADADDVYTKTETDNLLTAKADADDVLVYSTTEQAVGTWIDGLIIYRCVYNNINFPSSNTWTNLIDVSSLNIQSCIRLDGILLLANSEPDANSLYDLPTAEGTYFRNLRIYNNHVQTINNGFRGTGFIVLEYTKHN